MAHLHRPDEPLDQALERLARYGGPAAIRRDRKVVAALIMPEELERLEDERDAALLRAAMIEDRDGPGVPLKTLAADPGVDLER